MTGARRAGQGVEKAIVGWGLPFLGPFCMLSTLKPIFHCNANLFALGPHVGLDPNVSISRWGYQQALGTQGEPNESKWNIGCIGSPRIGAHVGHVHFMFFCVNFIHTAW